MSFRHVILGTAGHIDHGKTSLVKALTGVDTDRLPEEKTRGMTIDLGFAHLNEFATIIDVPGHEKFVKNMVAGVSTIDLLLFVIAADDGVMPQTREHLDICQLLQIPRGLIVLTKQCREVQDWFQFFADEFSCPIVGIMPPRHVDEVTQDEVDLVVKQFKNMIPICEQVSGQKFDESKFKETVRLSKEATLLWQKVLKTSTAMNAPLSFFDGTIHMGPIVVLRGTQVAKDYYTELLTELQENVKNNIGFLPQAKTRIFWEGMPIWGKLRMLSDLFTSNGAAVVASTYCSSWVFDKFDENDPWNSTARAYTEIFINRSEKAKMKMLADWFNEFKIDGIVYHDTKTCFNNSNAKFGMPQRLREITGVPALVVEGDLCDLRFFSEGQSITKIETFLEQLEENKILN